MILLFLVVVYLDPIMDNVTLVAMHHRNNAVRSRYGLASQTMDRDLTYKAQRWANYMARTGSFAHSNYGVQENIAMGYSSVRRAFGGWHGSRGHRANLLSGARLCGFGCQRGRGGVYYWVACYR